MIDNNIDNDTFENELFSGPYNFLSWLVRWKNTF